MHIKNDQWLNSADKATTKRCIPMGVSKTSIKNNSHSLLKTVCELININIFAAL